MSGFTHGRMIGEAQVIVGAQVENIRAVADAHARLLRRGEHTLDLIESLFAQPFGVCCQTPEEFILHKRYRCPGKVAHYNG